MFKALYNEDNYKFAGCPDKEDPKEAQDLLQKLNPNRKTYILSDSRHCTADIRMMNERNEELYLEIKRIPFAYEHEDEIGNSKSIDLIMFLISEIFETYDECANYIRGNYTVYIESGHITEFDKTTFYIEDYIQDNFETVQNNDITRFIEEFVKHIYDNYPNLGEFKFMRNKSRNPIIINFKPGIPSFKDYKNSKSNNEFDNTNTNPSLINFIIQCSGIYYVVPINSLKNKTISIEDFSAMVTDSKQIVDQVITNLNKSKNSFYGIDNNRIIIQELFYKYNNNDLFSDENDDLNGLGEIINIKLESELQKREAEISNFKNYFDRCFLFIPISNNAVIIMNIF